MVPMPTAGPHTDANHRLGKGRDAAQEAEHGRILRGGGLLQKVANVIAGAEDRHIALEHHHAHGWRRPWPLQQASAMAAYMSRVMEFFLSTRLKVMVVTPASVWTRMSCVATLVLVASVMVVSG
ncbi:MAG: hypothetical protein HEQ37_18185 [Acidovorax sp.]|nr:hypothetical protein [Acidovorax sp.]